MQPFVLTEANAALTLLNAFTPGTGGLGVPAWGSEQLLRDLELRLGLSTNGRDSRVKRVVRWAARMQAIAARGEPRFYSPSFGRDPLGTACAVLNLRDALRECAWDGFTVAQGGARLDALTELESLTTPAMPLGDADRALRVASALSKRRAPVYTHLTLAQDEAVWAACWRRVFAALRACGTPIHTPAPMTPQAPPDTDLGKVQRSLVATIRQASPPRLRGDGTFVRFVAETAFEAAQTAGAVLATLPQEGSLVIRASQAALLAHAGRAHGVASSGLQSSSPWRSALQVLPLAMDLAFEPKDPQRVLELLNLAGGPFTGTVTRRMTHALMRAPGVGGKAWTEAKDRLRARFADSGDSSRRGLDSVDALATWFETPGASAIDGAPKSILLDIVARVRLWLCQCITTKPTDTSLRVALRHCDELAEALEFDARTNLNLVHVRRLTEFIVSEGASLELEPECVGRIATLSSPHALHTPVETLVWWMFTLNNDPANPSPWRTNEQRALTEANIQLPDRELQLVTRANGLRNAVLAAKQRLFVIAPNTAAGQACSPHPLWDELVARLRLTSVDQAAVTGFSCDIIGDIVGAQAHVPVKPDVRTALVEPLRLPRPHTSWHVTFDAPITFTRYSSASLSSLLGCPLQWALTYLAGVSTEEQALTSQHILNGTLGHRLVEELHEARAFNATREAFTALATTALDKLLQQEGATLLRPGKAHELSQLRRRLVEAACSLKELLNESELRIRSVEAPFETPWGARQVHGRWDLVVETTDGEPFIIDLKWGFRRYKDVLKAGTALQLALYGHALSANTSAPIQAAYYSLTGRRLFGVAPNIEGVELVPGPSLDETWRRAALTLPLVENNVSAGHLYVVGVGRALPLMEHLRIPRNEHHQHYMTSREEACGYCRYDVICGKRWEAIH